jgi:hypothetical protein
MAQSIPLEQLMMSFEAKKPPLLSVDEIYKDCSQTILEQCREDRRIERKPATYNALLARIVRANGSPRQWRGGLEPLGNLFAGPFETERDTGEHGISGTGGRI